MKTFSCLRIISSVWLLSCGSAFAQELELFANPLEGEAVVFRLAAGAPELEQAEPALDPAAAAEGWQAVELTGPFTGYVAETDLDKTGAVPIGAPLLNEPADDAHILTFVEKGDRIEVTQPGDWTEVRFSKPLILYFQKPPAPTPAVVVSAPSQLPKTVPAKEKSPTVSAPAAAPLVAPPAAPHRMPGDEDVVELPATEVLPPERITPPPARNIAEIYEGIFRPSDERITLLPQPFPYLLENASGERIAYLDLSKAQYLGLPLDYFAKPVTVNGILTEGGNPKRLVIRVESMR